LLKYAIFGLPKRLYASLLLILLNYRLYLLGLLSLLILRFFLLFHVYFVHNYVINLAFQWCLIRYRDFLRLFSLLNSLDIFVVVNGSNILDVVHYLNYTKIQRTLSIGNAHIAKLFIVHEVREFANFTRLNFFLLFSHHLKLTHTAAALAFAQLWLLIKLALIVEHFIMR
jgi:hypothetical protein